MTLAELEKLCEGATEGPWRARHSLRMITNEFTYDCGRMRE